MRFKDFLSVPEGQRVTERYLYRILISAVCCILICIGYLAGTTWAWFTVSIENTENLIQIGSPQVTVIIDEVSADSGVSLSKGNHTVKIIHGNKEVDSLSKKSTLYVTFTIDETNSGYVILNEQNNYISEIKVANEAEKSCDLVWTVSWFVPVNVQELSNDVIVGEKEDIEQITEFSLDNTSSLESGISSGMESSKPEESQKNLNEESIQVNN